MIELCFEIKHPCFLQFYARPLCRWFWSTMDAPHTHLDIHIECRARVSDQHQMRVVELDRHRIHDESSRVNGHSLSREFNQLQRTPPRVGARRAEVTAPFVFVVLHRYRPFQGVPNMFFISGGKSI